MSKCGKGCMPECEYFTTGGCISPFNCMYKEESGYINIATSGTVIYTGGMNMTNEEMIENLKCVIADISAQCEQLKAENAALQNKIQSIKEVLAKYLADLFGCPCNYSSLDEEMANYCGDECNMDDDVACWLKVFEKDEIIAADENRKERQGGEE